MTNRSPQAVIRRKRSFDDRTARVQLDISAPAHDLQTLTAQLGSESNSINPRESVVVAFVLSEEFAWWRVPSFVQ